MAVLAECPICHKKQSLRNRLCGCGEDLVKAKKSSRVRFWINYRLPNGKQVRKIEGRGFDLTETKAAEGKTRAMKVENRILDIKPEAKMSFKELAKWYLDLESVKALARYTILTINLNSFNQVFGDTIVNQLKPVDLENYQAKRKAQGQADSYIDQQIAMARAMINKAFDNDIVSGDIIKVFKRVKKLLKGDSNARDRVLSSDEFTRLMDALPSHTRAIVATGYYAGMRKSEVINLTWNHIDMKSLVISLEASETKDREARKIPICDGLYDILVSIPKAIHDNHVFLYKGKPIRDIRTALTNACEKAEIPYGRGTKDGFVFHDTRHCFNTNMRKAGVPESVIMKITGHSTREMFLRYDSVDSQDTRKAVDQMEGFLKSVDQNVDQAPLKATEG
ncbi:MAG: tyrosine-type recombinase/integrase [Syntrophus sp. (in: bacteria)]